ncbi:MAG: glycosyltransferase family 2 protein [Planctomycetia bacterium]|nr:glycosyltransferase family 2 protein [Planctomycetia bacterium]
MDTFFFTTLVFWLVAAVGTIALFELFRRHVERSTSLDAPKGFAADQWPEALVVMSLRGGDESLRETLDGLAQQDYPRYRIRIVVDHPGDEVNRIVRSWQRTHADAPLRVEYLRAPLPSCTLKCSSVHQVLRDVGPEVGVVVMVDGDSDPYPRWLRDVVAPFADPEVGGVTGNRWYFPREGGIAAWCRFVFTAFSLPTMWLQSFSWGGTLALRRDIACSDRFLSAFAQTPTEEQTCFEVLPSFGKKMYFSSQLIQWNPESIDFEGAEQHLFRQLAWSRLFYPCWTSIVFGALALCGAAVASLVFAGFAFFDSRLLWLLPLAMAGMFCAAVVSSLARLHQTMQRHVLTHQGRMAPPLSGPRLAELFVSLPVSLAVYLFALARSHFATEIHWRGILYRIFSDDTISRSGYSPWKADAPARSKTEASPAPAMQVDRQHAIGS